MNDPVALLFTLGLGPWLTPLRGKVPVLDAWQSLPPVDGPTVREWLEVGYNLGFRTGARSGLVVIDDDQARNGASGYTAPPTGLVAATPTGGRHSYYRAPDPCPRNSASRLAPHVDVRGEGGQCVVPPSIHPTALTSYRWVSTGEPGAYPAEPESATVRVDLTTPETRGAGYARAALLREVHAVRTATEGARNDTLNRAAFNLGQLVAGGSLSDSEVRAELESAAVLAGLPSAEAARTIASGLRGGSGHPRSAPVATVAPAPAPADRDVLVPGSHVLPPHGEYVEQGTHAFAAAVLSKLPPGTLYRRAGILGEISDGSFCPVPTHRLRTIVDASVRLTAGKPGEDEPTVVYRTCTRDHAQVIQEFGAVLGSVRQLAYLAMHPVCVGADFAPARPGWNADHGVFMSCEVPAPLPLPEGRAVLEDLVADFPFQAASDRANLFGLLLTPILRPAIAEPVPMHLICSPMERTGKTKLAEIVLGVTVSGRRLPAMQLGDREEEREKRILSVLLRGQGMIHLDNLGHELDSASLASLLTSSEYQGRVLGSSSAPSVPNTLVVVGTGNNVHATGELAKRIVPIRLLPTQDRPEDRQDFRHPDLVAYVTEARPRVLGALLGLVAAWREAGRPLASVGFGGFERWAAVVGGILSVAEYTDWLRNLRDWRGGADDAGQEHRELVTAWSSRHAREWVASSALYDLAVELDLYGWLDSSKTDRARRRSFAARVIGRLVGRVLLDHLNVPVRVMADGVGNRRRCRLSEVIP